jgi:hypothetical protein
MWVTFVIAGAFVVAFIAMGYFGVKEHEDGAPGSSADALPAGPIPGVRAGRPLTRDQVVFELEHRIDEELRDIDYALRAPERYPRIFET